MHLFLRNLCAHNPVVEPEVDALVLAPYDLQPSFRQHLADNRDSAVLHVAVVAAQFDGILPFGQRGVLGRHGVGHHQRAAGPQRPLNLVESGLEVPEMVRGLAAGDQVQAARGEWQRLGRVLRQAHIWQPSFTADTPGLQQHRLGDVAGHDPAGDLSHRESGESGSGPDVHGPSIGGCSLPELRPRQLLHRFEAVVADVHLAGGIHTRLWTEHLLRQRVAGLLAVFGHAYSKNRGRLNACPSVCRLMARGTPPP